MKVIKNCCYGGFGISLYAALKLLKKKGTGIYAYAPDSDNPGKYRRLRPKNTKSSEKNWYDEDIIYSKVYYGEELVERSSLDNGLKVQTDEMTKLLGNPDALRFDKDLISLLEKHGSKKISDAYAKLEIEAIKKGVNFKVLVRDGKDFIETSLSDSPTYYAYE